ncbi:MAG: NAD(P)/FAD-dependent oxidoreductase [Tannerellaceae bacterium]|nr:NAD(P)/FAD-dependent oxidoreductase [Tannerellaceae bacterium]
MDCNIPNTGKKRVVIVGGGFAGLELVHRLKDSDYQLVLIDRNNYHQFPPLLYQVATADLEVNSISFPFRKMFQKYDNSYFRLGEVCAIDFENNSLETSIDSLSYDYLVLAAGTETNYYGNEQIKATAFPMKTSVEALDLRNAIISAFEQATITSNVQERQSLLNIVIAGGGPSGVELAGALAEMKKYIVPKDYPELSPLHLNIYLVEGADRLLGPMSKQSSANAKRSLEKMGVNIILNKKVSGYDGENVLLEDKTTIPCKTFIWVSGVTATRFGNIGKEKTGRGGRILVNEYNQIHGSQNVFAVGDVCFQTEEKYPNGHPQVAQVAIQQGRQVAKNLKDIAAGKPMEAFHYKNLGTLATIGRNRAVADLGSFRMHGFPAWLVWILVHLRSILGVKNKMVVILDWLWNYFSYDQSERYILAVPPKSHDEKDRFTCRKKGYPSRSTCYKSYDRDSHTIRGSRFRSCRT